jgi:hypothetical protein
MTKLENPASHIAAWVQQRCNVDQHLCLVAYRQSPGRSVLEHLVAKATLQADRNHAVVSKRMLNIQFVKQATHEFAGQRLFAEASEVWKQRVQSWGFFNGKFPVELKSLKEYGFVCTA